MARLDQIRLSPANFLVDAAITHFRKTGATVKGFVVPKAMFEELKSDSKSTSRGVNFMLNVDGFTVIGCDRVEPCLVEDRNSTVVPLL
jgi:hypothetical protein